MPHAQQIHLILTGFRLDTDAWLKEYEKCKDLTQEIVQNIQVWCAVCMCVFCAQLPWLHNTHGDICST